MATTSPPSDRDYRPSYLAATIASVLVFILYLLTLAPSTAMWDTSEYITAAQVLGLPHPPGNPLFVLIGRVFAILPIASSIAVRVNVLAALCSAISAGMWFLITERVLVGWFAQRWQRIVGGSLAALIGATSFTVWNQSVVNEKVYTVSLMGIAIISWLMIRWCDEPDGRRADRILVLVAYLCGLGYANHMAGMLAAPAVGLAVLVMRWRTILRWKLLLACVGALVLGITPFAMEPIRAAHFPALNEGEPTACRVELNASCTFSKGTYDAFMYNFNRGQYGKPALGERQAPFTAQLDMWWFYFKWQWLRDAHVDRPFVQSLLGALFLALGLAGGYVHWQKDRRSFWYFGSLMFTMTLVLIYYLNFKYGASQSPELVGVAREVRDRDYFYLWSFSAWGVWAALGLVALWETLAELIGREQVAVGRATVERPTRRAFGLAAPVLALALIPLFTNWSTASRAGQTDTADFAKDLLNSVEPYGVLVTVGDNDTFPLWYAQEVEGVRRDVLVANTSLLNTDWYTRQLIRRPVYTYDAAAGPAIYRGKSWPKPSGPAIKMTMMQADSVPAYIQLDQPMTFQGGPIKATIDPQRLSIPGVLQRADIFVLRMIADDFGDRPIYFSRTSAGYGNELGLGSYLLTQGLANKVFIPPAAPGKDTLLVAGAGWVDVQRTKALWDSVFTAPASLSKRSDWVDRPSVGIPYLYIATGLMLSEVLNATGQSTDAGHVLAQTKQIAKAVQLTDLLAQIEQPESLLPESNPLLVPRGDTQRGQPVPAKP
jgi:transmembrane protein TMEM260 (protein O-mannosyltransferase)